MSIIAGRGREAFYRSSVANVYWQLKTNHYFCFLITLYLDLISIGIQVLIGLFFSIVITTINSTGNGVFFFTVHATPATPSNQSVQSAGNKTHVELGNAFLNVITEVKNPFTFSGFIINGTHRGFLWFEWFVLDTQQYVVYIVEFLV